VKHRHSSAVTESEYTHTTRFDERLGLQEVSARLNIFKYVKVGVIS
jgi:hypothetical protein